MADNFAVCLPWVLAHEGGYVNHPKDPGGATNKGITHRTYRSWLKRQGLPNKDVRNISDAEVAAIYKAQYWDAVKGDDLPAGLDYAVFDYAVNSGPGRSARYLQRIVGVTQDGMIGVQTLAAVEAFPGGAAALITDLCNARMAFLRRLKTFKTFGRGWTRRVMGEMAGVQRNDHGTIDRSHMLVDEIPDIPAPKVLNDGAKEKAVGPETIVASIGDAVRDKGAAGIGAGVTAGVTALSGLEGPIAYALAAVIVIVALGGLVWLVRRTRTA